MINKVRKREEETMRLDSVKMAKPSPMEPMETTTTSTKDNAAQVSEVSNLIKAGKWNDLLEFLYTHEDIAKEWITEYNPDGTVRWKSLPIHLACEKHPQVDLIQNLLSMYPESLNLKNYGGDLPIHVACREGAYKDVIIHLLLHDPFGSTNVKNCEGCLPLHLASRDKTDKEVIKGLLDVHEGAAQISDDYGLLPLHWSCSKGASPEVVGLLIDAYPEATEKKDTWGRTPLELAKSSQHKDSQKILQILSSTPSQWTQSFMTTMNTFTTFNAQPVEESEKGRRHRKLLGDANHKLVRDNARLRRKIGGLKTESQKFSREMREIEESREDDVKRYQEFTEEEEKMKSELNQRDRCIAELQSSMSELEISLKVANESKDNFRVQIEEQEQLISDMKNDNTLTNKIEMQANQIRHLEEKYEKEREARLALENGTTADLRAEIEEQREMINTLNADILKGEDIRNVMEDELVRRIENRDQHISELEANLVKGEKIRRVMHSRIQELRGNIRVYVRTRPFLPSDGPITFSPIESHPDDEALSICPQNSIDGHIFKFDKVFPPCAGQDAVFEEVADFVQSTLDGYHVCLFSYGQTGSGKTHTMQGNNTEEMRGIIPRSTELILAQVKEMQTQHWRFSMRASFLEIYNEELRDLLGSMSRKSSSTSHRSRLGIRKGRNGKSYVEGLTEVDIDTEDSERGMQCLKAVMAAAARTRSVASTNVHAQSSRSHSVFMLHVTGINEENGIIVEGALNLCDLAGSERLSRSGAGNHAQRLKETQAINKSLSSLGDVFTALANGAKHIPYRNSKLTYLLQDCLSNEGKALMFVNLSPTETSCSESLCSLRFAQRVNRVELGRATKNVVYGGQTGTSFMR